MYQGVIIEESLKNKDVLKNLKFIDTKVEPVTPKHKTPWLTQWTLHTVEVPEDKIRQLAEAISHSLDRDFWYADFRNANTHYIIFLNKVFKVDLNQPEQYKPVVDYGLSLGVPDYQLDFAPTIKQWKRPEPA